MTFSKPLRQGSRQRAAKKAKYAEPLLHMSSPEAIRPVPSSNENVAKSGIRTKSQAETGVLIAALTPDEAYVKTGKAVMGLMKMERTAKDRLKQAVEAGKEAEADYLKRRLAQIEAVSGRLVELIDDLHDQEVRLRADRRRELDPAGLSEMSANPELVKRIRQLKATEDASAPVLLEMDEDLAKALEDVENLKVRRPAKRAATGGKEAVA